MRATKRRVGPSASFLGALRLLVLLGCCAAAPERGVAGTVEPCDVACTAPAFKYTFEGFLDTGFSVNFDASEPFHLVISHSGFTAFDGVFPNETFFFLTDSEYCLQLPTVTSVLMPPVPDPGGLQSDVELSARPEEILVVLNTSGTLDLRLVLGSPNPPLSSDPASPPDNSILNPLSRFGSFTFRYESFGSMPEFVMSGSQITKADYSACPEPPATPSETPTVTQTRTSTPTATITSTATSTPSASVTPTSTATHTPTATRTPAAPSIQSGATEGSMRVSGRARPDLPDGCLRILAGDGNEHIGSGGSDPAGRFSIELVRPLLAGEMVRAVDVCDPFSAASPLLGPVLRVSSRASVPALSPPALVGALIVLTTIAALAIRRRT